MKKRHEYKTETKCYKVIDNKKQETQKHSSADRMSWVTARSLNAGRSMLEMLGVLAIIGVLSIGGLAAFKIAMNYHRANETIHDVMLRATNVPMKWDDYANFDGDEFLFPDLGAYATKNAVGYTVHTYPEPIESAYLYRVDVTVVPTAVCKRIINMNPTAVDLIKVGAAAGAGGHGAMAIASECEAENELTNMSFYFIPNFGGKGPEPIVCDPACEADKCCIDGVCKACPCTEDTQCGNGLCCNAGVCGACPITCDETKRESQCERCVNGEWIYPCDATACQECNEKTGECFVDETKRASQCERCVNGEWIYPCNAAACQKCNEETGECVLDETGKESACDTCENGAWVSQCDSAVCQECNEETGECFVDETGKESACDVCENGAWISQCDIASCTQCNETTGACEAIVNCGGGSCVVNPTSQPSAEEACPDEGEEVTEYQIEVTGHPETKETCCLKCENDTRPLTAYWDGQNSVCCYGKVFIGDSILGADERELSICCDTAEYGDAVTAYWDGTSVKCCGGSVYQGIDDKYHCCEGATLQDNPSSPGLEHVIPVAGWSEKRDMCCASAYMSAYWNGSSTQCCSGAVYQSGEKKDGKAQYGCCTDENDVAADVEGGQFEGQQICCDTTQYGDNPTAYWNGTSAQCCAGTAYEKYDGTYGCCTPTCIGCDEAGNCANGYEKAINYIDDFGACGYVCCETKADDCEEITCKADYKVAGAVNGTCCSGYTVEYWTNLEPEENNIIQSWKYALNVNGGIPYCAEDYEITGDDTFYYYVGVNKYCQASKSSGKLECCSCSYRGDPADGFYCDGECYTYSGQ